MSNNNDYINIVDIMESDDVRLVSDEIDKTHNYRKKVIYFLMYLKILARASFIIQPKALYQIIASTMHPSCVIYTWHCTI